MQYSKICILCGAAFTAKRDHAVYCSSACRSRGAEKRAVEAEDLGPAEPIYKPARTCPVCGKLTANWFKCFACWEAEEINMYGHRVSRVDWDPYGTA